MRPARWSCRASRCSVPKGSNLYLLASPVADMFASHTGRTPGLITLDDTVVHLPALRRP